MKTLYFNGDIITVNDAQPNAEALLVENGKIVAVGALADVQSFADEKTVRVNLDGKTMLPGFIDGHGHIGNAMAGLPQMYPPPNGTIDSKEKLLSALKKMVDKGELVANGWLVAMGYDNAFFENEEHPTRYDLDTVTK